jgi:hypothetical protein
MAMRTARWMLIGTETVIGANAVYGGVGLIRDGLGMPSEWLEPTPFGSWVLPGVFLLAVIAAPMFAAAVLESVQSRWAYAGSMFAAACQLGWIIAQVVIIQRYFFLQPVLFGAGLLVGALAMWAHRGGRLFPARAA